MISRVPIIHSVAKINMKQNNRSAKGRRGWAVLFLACGIVSAIYCFRTAEEQARFLHSIDAPIGGTVSGQYRITGIAERADGSDDVLPSRLNSSNVVCYYLEQHVLKDGKWVPQHPVSDSVPYVLRDDSAAIQTRDYQLANAFSRMVERGGIRQRQAMLMVAEQAIATGTVELMADGRRYFDGKITPKRFYQTPGNVLHTLAGLSVYINILFCVITISADYRSSRYGRGIQSLVSIATAYVLILCFQVCLFREGHRSLIDEYQNLHSELIVAESRIPRGQWVLAVDAYNEHALQLESVISSFPSSLAASIFGLPIPKEIPR